MSTGGASVKGPPAQLSRICGRFTAFWIVARNICLQIGALFFNDSIEDLQDL